MLSITDDNRPENVKQAAYDERIKLIIKNSDKSLLWDLGVNNTKNSSINFGTLLKIFWMKLLQLTTGIIMKEVVVNLPIATSARDLYKKIIVKQGKDGTL